MKIYTVCSSESAVLCLLHVRLPRSCMPALHHTLHAVQESLWQKSCVNIWFIAPHMYVSGTDGLNEHTRTHIQRQTHKHMSSECMCAERRRKEDYRVRLSLSDCMNKNKKASGWKTVGAVYVYTQAYKSPWVDFFFLSNRREKTRSGKLWVRWETKVVGREGERGGGVLKERRGAACVSGR